MALDERTQVPAICSLSASLAEKFCALLFNLTGHQLATASISVEIFIVAKLEKVSDIA